MEIDKTTLKDLSVFDNDDTSIFDTLDFTRTVGGREMLRHFFSRSLNSIEAINDVQQTIQVIHQKKSDWPEIITNGTIMVIQKFYEASIDQIPLHPSATSAYAYKLLHAPDFSLVKYSTGHCFDFIKGMMQLIKDLSADNLPQPLHKLLQKASSILDKEQFKIITKKEKYNNLSIIEMLQIARFFRYHYKQNFYELMEIYYHLDAWYSMALATDKFSLSFPVFINEDQPSVKVSGLYHVLLPEPVSYDLTLNKDCNFIFLTGANMGGKSTFIKSVGAAVFLAHIGMAVPAKFMQLTLFNGLLSNINVTDNIAKGESYFYNEVQRIKNTIVKINDGRKWLVLIDELFKGTNVQDAMKCSTAVIEGLIKIKNSLFILSTHLYEIGDALKAHPNINFKYFETLVTNDELQFSYKLKDGISNDRLGYLILKREGVVDLLEKL